MSSIFSTCFTIYQSFLFCSFLWNRVIFKQEKKRIDVSGSIYFFIYVYGFFCCLFGKSKWWHALLKWDMMIHGRDWCQGTWAKRHLAYLLLVSAKMRPPFGGIWQFICHTYEYAIRRAVRCTFSLPTVALLDCCPCGQYGS